MLYHPSTMLKRSLLIVSLLVPVTALALDFSVRTPYKDVRTNSLEEPAIAALTNEGVVKGYGNGFFGLSRKINRVEFLKIALLSAPAEKVSALQSYVAPTQPCFADAPSSAWFHRYACYARQFQIVKGYPAFLSVASINGPVTVTPLAFLKPAQEVTYGEALKMLVIIYGYPTDSDTRGGWAQPYYKAAAKLGVDLPITIQLDKPLIRGQAARLAAAFRAESEGQLELLRRAEAGEDVITSSLSSSISSSPSSSSSSSLSSSSSSSASSASSASSSSSLFSLPSRSHFLLVGQSSDSLADGVLKASGEARRIQIARVKLFNEATAVQYIDLVTEKGDLIIRLNRRVTTDLTDYKQIYEANVTYDQAYRIPANTDLHIIARAVVRSLENNGVSDQYVHMREFSVTTVSEVTIETVNTVFPLPFPAHQTAFGRIAKVERAGAETGPLTSMSGGVIAAFAFTGEAVATRKVALEHLRYTLSKSDGVNLSLIRLTRRDSGAFVECTMGTDGLNCRNIPLDMGILSAQPVIFDLKANIQVAGTNQLLNADLVAPGNPNEDGAVQWTDESGHFRWMEGVAPLAKGMRWTK